MKLRTQLIGAAFAGIAFPFVATAQVTEEKTETTVEEHEDGSVTETTTTTTTTFTPDVRQKVITYFEPFKSQQFGLPPAVVSKIRAKEIPVAWRSGGLEAGIVIEEGLRTHLVAAPPELVEVLPEPEAEVRYYVAGSNVVAVDPSFRVVDVIHVPSIKITVDE